MRNENQPPKDTFESVLEALRETRRSIEAVNLQREKEFREMRKSTEDLKRGAKVMQKELGGIGRSNGAVAETYFVNSFSKSMEFAGQKYDSLDSGLKRKIKSLNLQGEYDLLLYNCTSVAIIEIKYSAEKKHIGWFLKRVAIFKQLFPQYANFDLYLGLAALHFKEGTEEETIANGIAIIKQVGKSMVIYDAHLKVF